MSTTSMETIRRVTIQGSAPGVDAATAALQKLAAAQGGLVVASEKTNKAQLSAQGGLDRYTRSLDPTFRATQDYQKAVTALERAHAQGLTTLERHNQLLGLAAQKYGQTSLASQAFSKALGPLQGQMLALSTGAGPVGVFLAGLGPWGLAAAIGLGGITKGFSLASDAAHDFANRGRELRDSAESIGLTVNQLKGLDEIGGRVGVSAERVGAGLQGMTARLEEFRDAQGKAFNILDRYNSGLAIELASARSTAQAIDILSRAFKGLDTTQQNALGRALGFGRAPGDMIRLLTAVGNQGGVGSVQPVKPIDVDALNRTVQLSVQIEQSWQRIAFHFERMFAEPVLQAEKTFLEGLEKITTNAKDFKLSDDWKILLSMAGFGPAGIGAAIGVAAASLAGGARITVPPKSFSLPPLGGLAGIQGRVGTKEDMNPVGQMNLWERRNGILGSAMTLSEQYTQEVLKLNAAQDKDKFSTDVRNRALAAFVLTQQQSVLQTKEQIGVASQEEIYAVRLAVAYDDLKRKGLDSANNRAAAERMVQKEAKETYERMKIAASAVPGLTALGFEAGDLNKQFDQMATNSLNNISSGLLDIASGAKSAKDGFRDLGLQVVRSLEEMIIKYAIIAPLAKSLSSYLGVGGLTGGSGGGTGGSGAPVPSAMGNVFASGLAPFSNSVVSSPTMFRFANGVGLMGEAGPEAIMPLKRLPSGRLGIEGGGGVAVNVRISNSAGASVNVGEATRSNDGSIDLPIAIEAMQNRNTAGGRSDKAMRARFGRSPAVTRR